MRIFYYLLLIVVILFGVTFATLNMQEVSINYYLDQRKMPLALLLVLTFAGGFVFGLVIGFWLLLKAKIKHYRLRQRLTMVEKELENLRAIPLREKIS